MDDGILMEKFRSFTREICVYVCVTSHDLFAAEQEIFSKNCFESNFERVYDELKFKGSYFTIVDIVVFFFTKK